MTAQRRAARFHSDPPRVWSCREPPASFARAASEARLHKGAQPVVTPPPVKALVKEIVDASKQRSIHASVVCVFSDTRARECSGDCGIRSGRTGSLRTTVRALSWHEWEGR